MIARRPAQPQRLWRDRLTAAGDGRRGARGGPHGAFVHLLGEGVAHLVAHHGAQPDTLIDGALGLADEAVLEAHGGVAHALEVEVRVGRSSGGELAHDTPHDAVVDPQVVEQGVSARDGTGALARTARHQRRSS